MNERRMILYTGNPVKTDTQKHYSEEIHFGVKSSKWYLNCFEYKTPDNRTEYVWKVYACKEVAEAEVCFRGEGKVIPVMAYGLLYSHPFPDLQTQMRYEVMTSFGWDDRLSFGFNPLISPQYTRRRYKKCKY
jgi:hypothetical protein